MRPLHVIGLTALLFAVGACGQAADQATPASQPTPTSVSPSASDEPAPPSASVPPIDQPPPTATAPPEGSVLLPKDKVDTGTLPYAVRAWSVNGGRTVAVSAEAPTPCTPLVARVVEQNAELVKIAISAGDVPQGGSPDGPGICAQVISPRVLTVDLKVPLGDRKVVVTEGR